MMLGRVRGVKLLLDRTIGTLERERSILGTGEHQGQKLAIWSDRLFEIRMENLLGERMPPPWGQNCKVDRVKRVTKDVGAQASK